MDALPPPTGPRVLLPDTSRSCGSRSRDSRWRTPPSYGERSATGVDMHPEVADIQGRTSAAPGSRSTYNRRGTTGPARAPAKAVGAQASPSGSDSSPRGSTRCGRSCRPQPPRPAATPLPTRPGARRRHSPAACSPWPAPRRPVRGRTLDRGALAVAPARSPRHESAEAASGTLRAAALSERRAPLRAPLCGPFGLGALMGSLLGGPARGGAELLLGTRSSAA